MSGKNKISDKRYLTTYDVPILICLSVNCESHAYRSYVSDIG